MCEIDYGYLQMMRSDAYRAKISQYKARAFPLFCIFNVFKSIYRKKCCVCGSGLSSYNNSSSTHQKSLSRHEQNLVTDLHLKSDTQSEIDPMSDSETKL